MNCDKWNSVLIEWVNCLKLYRNISNLNELRNGEFFLNLQKVILKSRTGNHDVLTFIFGLFSKHYPDFSFENQSEIHLSDLPETDLKSIISLLMHYTCIYDRKDILLSPLCHSLSQTTQLIIRNFLQKLTKTITNKTIDDIIKSCIDDLIENSNKQWLSVESTKNSPLQDLFKTPVSKLGRLQEKDRIISQLRCDLETERYEKVELQEELKLQLEKNQKIELQIIQKNNEITRLRAEVLTLENRTPPHYQDMDSRELQRRLRSEIQSLEQYIKQIENEQDELRKEKDAAKEQLRKFELQANLWEEKFFETEQNLENLRDYSKKQEDELIGLQTHCAEITAMLDEFRTKNENDSSFYDTFNSIPNLKLNETQSCEDLACSVIEVQLRDAHKLIENLKGQIEEFDNKEADLQRKIQRIQTEFKETEELNGNLQLKIKNTVDENNYLERQLKETKNNLVENEKKLEERQTEIENLVMTLKTKTESLEKSEKNNEILQTQVDSLQLKNNELQIKLKTAKTLVASLETERDNLRKISERLQFELGDVMLQNQQFNKKLNDLKAENLNLLTNLDELVQNREYLELRSSESDNYIKKLQTEFSQLQQQQIQINNELSLTQNNNLQLQSKLNEIQLESQQLKDEKSKLLLKLETSDGMYQDLKMENTNLNTRIKNLTKCCDDTEHSLQIQRTFSEMVSKELDEMRLETQTLNSMLDDTNKKLQQSQSESLNLNSIISSFEKDFKSKSKLIENLETQIKEKTTRIESLQAEKMELSEIKENLEKQQESTRKLEAELKEIQNEKILLEMNVRNNENLITNLKKELDNVKLENRNICEKFNLKNEELEENLKDLENCKIEIEKLLQEKTELEKQLLEVQENLKSNRDEIKNLNIDLAKQLEENKIIDEKNKLLEDELTQTINDKFKLEISLKETQQAIKLQEVQNTEAVSNLRKELSDTENEFKKIQKIIEKENFNFKQTLKEKENLMNELEKIQTESNQEITKLRNELESKITSINKLKQTEKELKANLEKEKTKLTEELNLTLAATQELQYYKKKVENLEIELSKKSIKIEEEKLKLEQQQNESLSRILGLQAELNQIKTDLEKCKTEKNHLEDELTQTINDKFKLEITLKETQQAIKLQEAQNTEAVSNLRKKLSETENKLKENQKLIEQENFNFKQILKEKENLMNELKKIQTESNQEITKLRNELESKITSINKLKQTEKELKANLEKEKTKLTEELNLTLAATQELQYYKKKVEDLEIELSKKSIKIEEEKLKLEQQQNESLSRIIGLQAELNQINRNLEKCKTVKNHLETELLLVNETNNKNLNELTNLKRETNQKFIEEISREKQIQLEKIQIEENFKTLQDEFFEKIKNLQDKLDIYKKEKIELETNLKDKSNLILQLQSEKENLEIEKNSLLLKIKESEDINLKQIEDLQSHLEMLDRQLTEVSSISETLKIESEELRLQYQKAKQEQESLTYQNCDLKKKLEVEEIISSENRDRIKSLEETIQDYEITISGLKSVVDTNLEHLEILKEELHERNCKESDLIKVMDELLKDHNIGSNDIQDDLKTFILQSFEKILKIKKEEEQRIVRLVDEIENLKTKNTKIIDLNGSFRERIQKLQTLVNGEQQINNKETLYSCLDEIYKKITTILENHKENLQKSETKKDVVKLDKENILSVTTKNNKSREEELKKENMILKRKIVLAENSKNNLEKILNQLREDKKKIESESTNDLLYKKLLHDYIQVKEENQQIINQKDARILELTTEINNLKSMSNTEDDKKLQNIHEAYGNLMSTNSKLELEMVTIRKILEERNTELASMSQIKEAYEKLLEENNKLLTEIDTIKYKRIRDKEEFIRLLKKERDENTNRELKKIQEIRTEYEGKLEKMKEKMLKLYREEVNKKVRNVKDGHSETTNLIKTISALRSELFEADQKIQMLEMEKEMLKTRTVLQTVTSITTNEEKSATLPRLTKEITVSKRLSIGTGIPPIANLQMEDEEDLFNDKYLTDLKEGRCLSNEKDSVNRYSELAWRNSMVPPHLKSSYPAEMQFVSPTRFKEEDIKTGNIEFEDSLCKLLPGEKPRKKDFGTTSYKKPGPPTPSKNGGRLSLQGNEIHPIREQCEAKTPKKSTPSRIRALFTGRNNSNLKDTENQNNTTPSRGKRLSIFRRPK